MGFGFRYYAEFRSKYKGVFWRVEIHEREYSGPYEEMKFEGNSPLSITWERRGDEFTVPIKGSEATINILCNTNFHYIGLFTSDPRRFRFSVYRNTKLYWRGYVVADLYSENFTAPPYQVSIKAVDGFNLLSSITFRNLDGSNFTGRRSLWSLLSACLDLLELDIDVADWMDLYAQGMNERNSPLGQVFIEMDRLYMVYDEPSYRDIIEICLRPFAGQIFQSNGALHIRRAISLYRDNRPLSFYNIGSEFPAGWLVTQDGKNIVSADGQAIITNSTRNSIESIWNNDVNVSGESVMDIVPALRTVTVSVRNKMLTNLVPHIGFYTLSNWHDPNSFLALPNSTTLRFYGDSNRKNEVIYFNGYEVEKCSYKINLEYILKSYYFRRSSGAYRPGGSGNEYTVKLYYGFRVIGDKTFWLQDDGYWRTTDEYWEEEIKTTTELNKKIEIQGFPISGKLQMFIKQTLVNTGSGTSYTEESVEFKDMVLEIDTEDDYENTLKYQFQINHANNVDLAIELPISDIPNIPNDQLIYSLYFVDYEGRPTRMWKTKGCNDYNTLVNHLVQCALKYKQLPSRRIGGEMFTGKHIDMNTVVQDDKFLHAGFFVNSIELKAVEDVLNTELVEMPKLLIKDTPPTGDDCVLIKSLGFRASSAIKCENKIIIKSEDNEIYSFDVASQNLSLIQTHNNNVRIYPADSAYSIVDGSSTSIVDYRGIMIKKLQVSHDAPATWMGGWIYLVKYYYNKHLETGRETEYYYLNRPEYPYEMRNAASRGGAYNSGTYTSMNGIPLSLIKSYSSIAVNMSSRCYLHDRRSETDLNMRLLDEGSEMMSLSDYFMCLNLNNSFRIYRRDNLASETLLHSIPGTVDHADHTLGEVAYSLNRKVYIYNHQDNKTKTIINSEGSGMDTKGLFYMNGELYILRSAGIYKYLQ